MGSLTHGKDKNSLGLAFSFLFFFFSDQETGRRKEWLEKGTGALGLYPKVTETVNTHRYLSLSETQMQLFVLKDPHTVPLAFVPIVALSSDF